MNYATASKAEDDAETYIILSAGKADVIAEITSVRHDLTFSVIPSLSIIIIYKNEIQRRYLGSVYSDSITLTCAPACKNTFALSINHLGSRVPALSSSATLASPPAPH